VCKKQKGGEVGESQDANEEKEWGEKRKDKIAQKGTEGTGEEHDTYIQVEARKVLTPTRPKDRWGTAGAKKLRRVS